MNQKHSARRVTRIAGVVLTSLPLMLVALSASPSRAAAAAPRSSAHRAVAANPGSPQACAGLVGLSIPVDASNSAQVAGAADVAAANGNPQYCDVTGQIAGRINFEMRLPDTTWNGKYVQAGGGGFCGSIPTASGGGDAYMQHGAAVGSDDSGHTGTPFDASFGQNPQARIDWAYLAEHLMAETGKAVINAYYGAPPSPSYFIGCSTGGRQALMEAQRYPDDFDGIVGGDPANLQNYLAPLSQGYREMANRTTTPDHTMILRQQKDSIVANAVVAQCTAAGDAFNGVVMDPRLCPFNIDSVACPANATDTTSCLVPAEVDVLRKWYDSPRTSSGAELFPGGEPVGSENGWNLSAQGTDANYSFGGMFGDQDLKFLAYATNPAPTYGIETFDYDTDAPLLTPGAALYNADNPDMSAFHQHGGKFLLYHGFSDPLITPFQTIQYYEDGIQAMGGDLSAIQSWYRLFLLPGVYHCSGGPGPSTIDFYGAIDSWVENGTAPASLIASSSTMTMPVYPYPLDTKYAGGDFTNPSSYAPVQGPRGRAIEVAGLIQYPVNVPESAAAALLPGTGVAGAGVFVVFAARRRRRRGQRDR